MAKMVQLNVRVPPELRDAVNARARAVGLVPAVWIRGLLEREASGEVAGLEADIARIAAEGPPCPDSGIAAGSVPPLAGREKMEAQGGRGVEEVDLVDWLHERRPELPKQVLRVAIRRGRVEINDRPHTRLTVQPGHLGQIVRLDGEPV